MELIRRHLGFLPSAIPVIQQQRTPAQPKRRLRSVIVAVSSRPPSPERPERPRRAGGAGMPVEWDPDSTGLESRRYDSSEDDGRSAEPFNYRAEMFRMGFGISKNRQGKFRGCRGQRGREGTRNGQKKKNKSKRQQPSTTGRVAAASGPAPGSVHLNQLDDEASRFKEQLRLEKELMLARALESLAQDGT